MPTAACGINCDVCRLNLLGVCSTCGSGKDANGRKKLAAQERILGQPCPILACATEKAIEYCLRDCDRFPCDAFRSGPYPFSQGFLNMQDRRRHEKVSGKSPSGDVLKVPSEYWDRLQQMDLDEVCRRALAVRDQDTRVILAFLNEYLLIDIKGRCLSHQREGQWKRVDNSLLELLCLLYLLNVGTEPLAHEMVTVNQLKTGHFFKGPHELKIKPLVNRYGNDTKAFKRAAERRGGQAMDLADISYRLTPFPRTPLFYLLWEGDQDFEPNLSILFDRTVENHLAADAIWGLVNLVSGLLLEEDGGSLETVEDPQA